MRKRIRAIYDELPVLPIRHGNEEIRGRYGKLREVFESMGQDLRTSVQTLPVDRGSCVMAVTANRLAGWVRRCA